MALTFVIEAIFNYHLVVYYVAPYDTPVLPPMRGQFESLISKASDISSAVLKRGSVAPAFARASARASLFVRA
ncbi:hypothetical protein [Bifidobacterium merycicum]|uniref:hypothetical protein n=1 Tax=Bifidobacterium merycicum TaxID=78345 RepID=UPI001568E803|nr:hypothetical protein [Bifidobacterium merycicum]